MASEDGFETHSLIDQLAADPYRWDFYHAVRSLEALHPASPRVGTSLRVADDPVRFCQQPSLRFEPATLTEFRHQRADAPQRMFVAFLGLLGPMGPMPLHLTEFIRDRERNANDPTAARFLDIFNHRVISLFYRAWAVNQQAVSFDRPELDRYSTFIATLIGLGTPHLRNRDEAPDLAKLHYSGRLAAQTRNAEGLRAILEDYFKVHVEIEQFVGHWMKLPEDCQCRLGESRYTGVLGKTTIVGSKIWECQQRFRIRMGPMGFADYQRLLPSGRSIRRLRDWVLNYVAQQFGFDVQLVLRGNEVPDCKLGKGARLGWSTWMKTKPGPMEKDRDDLVLKVA
jgi:type VI secretion system protein ImpH